MSADPYDDQRSICTYCWEEEHADNPEIFPHDAYASTCLYHLYKLDPKIADGQKS